MGRGWPTGRVRGGFTLVELLVTIAIIGILAALLFPVLSKTRGKADKVVCLNNLRQLLIASTAYSGDNGDRVVLPGKNPDTTLFDCWLYAKGISTIASDASEAALEQQREYARKGLLFSYYSDLKILECSRDTEGRRDGQQRLWYLERPIKLTSYAMNGATEKFDKLDNDMPKMSAFKPDAVVFFEGNERRPKRCFKSGSYLPSWYSSQRHDAKEFKQRKTEDVGGGSLVGCFDGHVEFMKYTNWVEMAGTEGKRAEGLASGAAPNQLWCFPNEFGVDKPKSGAAE